MRKTVPSKYEKYFEEVERLYAEEYLSEKQVGDRLGLTKDTVAHILKCYLPHIDRNRTLGDYDYRKHSLNKHYFDEIDTEDKAYFLGFLYADGYCNDSGMFLTLQNQDTYILNTFAEYLESDSLSIKDFRGKYKRLTINSSKLADALHKQGCVQAKTKILKPPSLPDNLVHHFIRGYFDGDGSIWYDKNADSYRVQFLGTKEMVDYFQSFFGTNLKIRPANKDESIYRYGFSGNKRVSELLDKIYCDASPDLYLVRKHEKFLQCKELHKKKQECINQTWTNNLGHYAWKSVNEVCELSDQQV